MCIRDSLVGLRVGVSNVAVHLVVHRLVGHKAERLQQFVRVAGLAVQLAAVSYTHLPHRGAHAQNEYPA